MGKMERAARLSAAITELRRRGGSVKGLSRDSGVAEANIYRAMKDGTGIGRVMAEKLAPLLDVRIGHLLGDDDSGPAPKAKDRA